MQGITRRRPLIDGQQQAWSTTMMSHGQFNSWIATGLQLYLATWSVQKPPSSANVITHELSQFVQEVLNSSTIPGLSLGVVRLTDDKKPVAEYAAWGRQTEESKENDLTPDVSHVMGGQPQCHHTNHCLEGPVCASFMFKGVPCHVRRPLN